VEERAVPFNAKVGYIELAADVAGSGALDLDDARTEVSQAHGGGWPREEL
jgi:hypothetical protein